MPKRVDMAVIPKKVQRKQYWYRFNSYRCPVCGHNEGVWERERVYGKKPKSYSKRYIMHDAYDWCVEYSSIY